MRALSALTLVRTLQARLVAALDGDFQRVTWERDGGRHGGGDRLVNDGDAVFDRASVNVSCVHYDDEPERALAKATALSAIVHPRHPRAPSLHLHTSLTELRSGVATWRIMADLNPSHPIDADRDRFREALRAVAPEHCEGAFADGDRYFFIPALGRHRGVAHFYIEALPDAPAARELAHDVATAVIDTYAPIVAARSVGPVTEAERDAQLAYHTVYLLQVLTLDRGTTSGLLVHDQNDAGILGSLPSRLDPALLRSWRPLLPELQRPWLDRIVEIVADGRVELPQKLALAAASRAHYRAFPEALALQAR